MRLLVSLGMLGFGGTIASSAERPPNFVFLLADDVGYECFGAYGSRQYSTPRLDRMADAGARFSHCFSTPLCTPSRVALMTGMSNVRNYTEFGALLPEENTFADMFREAGYATAVAGKWQLQGTPNAAGVPPGDGFDSYCLWNTGNTEGRRYWNPSIECDGEILDVREEQYGPDIFSDFLLEFIETNRDRPFFAYYPMVLPHSPFPPTPHSVNPESQDEQRNFEDMVAYIDFIVGRFQDKLEELSLARHTVFLFTSDNGTHHRLRSALGGAEIRGDKGALTDAATHVPLIISAPGRIRGGRVLTDLMDFSDFLPTLAQAAGVGMPGGRTVDGISFWERLQGKQGTPREWHYTYYFPRPFAERFDNPYRHPEVIWVRDRRYKLYADGKLFDMRDDPRETNALLPSSGALEEVRRRLRRALGSMPTSAARIPPERSAASKGVARPRWWQE